jgi:hypothetical protein
MAHLRRNSVFTIHRKQADEKPARTLTDFRQNCRPDIRLVACGRTLS